LHLHEDLNKVKLVEPVVYYTNFLSFKMRKNAIYNKKNRASQLLCTHTVIQ